MINKIVKQEQIMREAKLFGNGAHIFVPKSWAGTQVLLIKKEERIEEKIMKSIELHKDSIIGLYLFGSRAREENEADSDIDILIVADEKFKIESKEINAIIIEERDIDKLMKSNPLMLKAALREAKPIINNPLLQKLKAEYKINKEDVANLKKQTSEMILKQSELLDLDKKSNNYTSPALIYSLILRLRGIFIIKSLIDNNPYSTKEFIKYLSKFNLSQREIDSLLKEYNLFKNDLPAKKDIQIDLAERILDILKKETSKLK